MSESAPDIEALKARHGDKLTILEAEGYTVVCKRVSRAAFIRFQDTLTSEKSSKNGAFVHLLYDAVVWPERRQLDEMLDEMPGLAIAFGAEVSRASGASAEVAVKKA